MHSSYHQQAREHPSLCIREFIVISNFDAYVKTDALCKMPQEVPSSRTSIRYSRIFPWAMQRRPCVPSSWTPTYEVTK